MWRALLVVGIAGSLGACGGSDAPPPPAPSEGSATVGAAGGVVNGPDGVTLSVPAGALTSATTFRIARDGSGAPQLGGAKPIAPIYAITPHGAELAESARVTIPFDPSQVAPGTRPVLLKASPGGTWSVLATDVIGNTASAADAPSLSYFTVGTCYTSRDPGVGGLDPIFYCPSAHELKLVLRNANNVELPLPRNAAGQVQPALTITAPTALNLTLSWTRPAGTQRSDTLDVVALNAGLLPAEQPLRAFAVNGNIVSLPLTVSIDPAKVPGAGNATGAIVRLQASASYTTDAFYPGCVCFRPATWTFVTEIPVRVIYTGVVPTITQQPASRSVVEGQTATFTVGATGPALSYQWVRATGQTESPIAVTDGSGARTATYTTPPATLPQNLTQYYARVCTNAGTAIERCVNSNTARLDVAPVLVAPTITTAPQSITVTEGETATFSAVANGSPAPTIAWGRVRNLAGGFTRIDPVCSSTTGSGSTTSASCTVGPVTLADNGAQFVAQVSNAAGNANSAPVTLTVLARPVAPTITSAGELADRSIVAGSGTSWTVTATGTAPISYGWFSTLPGANRVNGIVCAGGAQPAITISGNTLTLGNVPLACDGLKVEVVVSNAVGVAAPAARIATLSVTPAPAAPTFTTALADRTALDGTNVTFSVVATGSPSIFSYAWTFGGAPIAAPVSGCLTDSPSCTITARLVDTGKTMRVVASNGVAPDAISSGVLTVTTNDVAASITQQPANANTVEGGSATFTIGVAGTPTPTVQWQTSTDGVTWTNAGTGTTFTIASTTLTQNGLRIRAIVTNTIATASGPSVRQVTSSEATLAVAPTPAGMVLLAGDFSGGGGGGGLEGTGTAARFDFPDGLVADSSGNLYVAQPNGKLVSKVSSAGVVSFVVPPQVGTDRNNFGNVALAPNGTLWIGGISYSGLFSVAPPLVSGATLTSYFVASNSTGSSYHRGIAVNAAGQVFITNTDGSSIARVDGLPGLPTPTLVAGAPTVYDPVGSVDGTGTSARFAGPRGMAFGPNGDLFIADTGNHTIRRMTPTGVVTTFAGSAGQKGSVDGTGNAARFNTPTQVSFNADGNLYVLQIGDVDDGFTVLVRKITPAGVVTTAFNAGDEAAALATPAQNGFARTIRGMAVINTRQIALTSGNAIVVRTLP